MAKYVGAHVSAAGGVQNAPLNACAIGAKAFALFTKNQRQWKARPLEPASVKGFKENLARCGLETRHVLAHDSYLINLGHPDEAMRRRSQEALLDEARRCEALGIRLLNTHPGSHLGRISEEECIERIAESVNHVLDATESVTIVLENTAGQGSNMGYRFEQLGAVMARIRDQSRVGLCLDTCHAFAAGYDLRSREGYRQAMEEIDRWVGTQKLMGAHLNDSKRGLGSRVDRHESLGMGELGLDPFRFIMNDPAFDDIPLILETIRPERWPEEILLLYSLQE